MISVREERAEDREAVRRVEEAAFGRAEEADIVDALRGDEAWALSLVAEVDGAIVGHLLFSRGDRATTLGPLAVLPEHQRSGLGAALMHEGLARIDEPIVLVGHPDYYSRFGFRPAAPLGITNQWGIDAPAWMVRGELEPGLVRFPAAFGPGPCGPSGGRSTARARPVPSARRAERRGGRGGARADDRDASH